jgi:hypothetical protein
MTAINEQGQFYWTFEELDFVGAYVKVQTEWMTQVVVCNHFNKISQKYNFGSMERDLLKVEWDKSLYLVKYLHSVMKSFYPYLTTEEYNGAREKAYSEVLDYE